MTGSKHTGKN